MKKRNILKGAAVLLIASVLILTSIAAMANTQTTVKVKDPKIESFDTFTEGFEGGVVPPTDWLNIDHDGDGFLWKIIEPPGFPPHSGDFSAGSESYDAVQIVPLTPDNWLITPPMIASDITELSYWVAAQDPDWAQEHIEVWISTTGTTVPDDFTDQVDDYTCPAGSSDWSERVIDLSSYDGENIYIAFRHCDCTDWFWIKIDDVTVTNIEFGEPPKIPDLDCDGTLSWTEVTPEETVTGTFTVENIGDPLSLLDWEIESYPTDWGTFTFDPDGGLDLTPEAGAVTVTVDVVAPEDPETNFTGEIVLVNSEDSNDICIIDVSLATPVSQQSLIFQLFEMLAQRFPILGMILAALF